MGGVFTVNSVIKDGDKLCVKFPEASASPTVNINGVVYEVKKPGGSPFKVKANGIYNLVVDSGSLWALGGDAEYGTATADKVLTGYSVGTENGLINGTMPNNGAAATAVSNGSIKAGYTSGGAIANAAQGNIKKNVNICGVVGTLEERKYASGEQRGTPNNTYSVYLGWRPSIVVLSDGSYLASYGSMACDWGSLSGASYRCGLITITSTGFDVMLGNSTSYVKYQAWQ